MAAGEAFLLVIAFFVVLVCLVLFINWKNDTARREVRNLRGVCREQSRLINTIDSLAYEHRELDSMLATQIVDEIRKYKLKELE